MISESDMEPVEYWPVPNAYLAASLRDAVEAGAAGFRWMSTGLLVVEKLVDLLLSLLLPLVIDADVTAVMELSVLGKPGV